MICHISTQSRQKYSHPSQSRSRSTASTSTTTRTRTRTRNIMWTHTNAVRTGGMTSEFDAVVLHSHSHSHSHFDSNVNDDKKEENDNDNDTSSSSFSSTIAEIWEAKHSISPSSLHDVLTKKVPAIQTLLMDDNLSMSSYHPNENDSFHCHDHHLVPKKSNAQNDPDKTTHPHKIILGIFGNELLTPSHAIGQLKSTAVSYALTNDINVVMNAIKTGRVELDVNVLLHDLKQLRQTYSDACQEFHIVVKTPTSSSSLSLSHPYFDT